MIRDLSEITTQGWVELVYDAIAASIAAGVVVGIAVVWLSTAARGTDGT